MQATSNIGFVLMLTIVAMWTARAVADTPTTVSCDGFVLGFSGQVDKKACSTEDLTNGRRVVSASKIEIQDARFYLTVTYYESKFMTYYAYRSLRDQIRSNRSFSKITGWQALPDSNSFNVAAFSAVLASNSKTIVCAIFSRYSGPKGGPYEYDSGPGYKNVLEGYYCPRDGFTSTAAGSAPMTALEDNLGKLQIPPP